MIGTKDGILRAGTIRRVGGHRRWDREGLERVQGVPWQWDPEQGEVHADLKIRWLTEEEWDRGGAVYGDEGKKVYRLRLRKVDFLNHGFTEGCVGCQASISGAEARGHSKACRERTNKALENTDEGRLRRERQHMRENEALAKHLEKEFGGNDEERSRKVARQVEQATGSERPKRKFEDDVQDGSASSSWENVSTKSQKGLTLQRGQKRSAEDEEKDMDVSIIERTIQEDTRWDLMKVCDMSMEDPVVPLERNLYCHPWAELLWERQFEKILLKHGWEKVSNWECLIVHREKGLFLSVYVDDKIRWKETKS